MSKHPPTSYTGMDYTPEDERQALIGCIMDRLKGADKKTLRIVYAAVKGIVDT